jgi:hypothetical protein
MAKKKYLTIIQAAEKLGISIQAIYLAINEHRITACIQNDHYSIAVSEVMRFERTTRRPGRKVKGKCVPKAS